MADRQIRSANRRAVSYIDKSREFYAAQGYEAPYQWAVHDDAPFQPPKAPLTRARIGVVTTAFPVNSSKPKRVLAAKANPAPQAMYTADLSWHKQATHTNDVASFLPLQALRLATEAGTVGATSHRFYCLPTRYSQRATLEDGAKIVDWCKEDRVDAVILVPL